MGIMALAVVEAVVVGLEGEMAHGFCCQCMCGDFVRTGENQRK